jgi:16S rRNA (cytidine1402-2'-O)-methyltransferase
LKYKNLDATIILYVPLRKLNEILKDVKEILGKRYLCLARELTKIHEEFIRGKVESIIL